MASHSNIVSCNTIKITTTNMHLKMDRWNGPQKVHKLMPLSRHMFKKHKYEIYALAP